jgi:hypothetical protein
VKVLNTLLEIIAVVAVMLLLLNIWQNGIAATYTASAAANRTNAYTGLITQTGNGVLGLLGFRGTNG